MVKKKKENVPLKTFKNNESFQLFINDEKDWMYTRIVDSIQECFSMNEKLAVVMEAKIEDTMSVITISSDVVEWPTSLSMAIDWYSKDENYEKCAKIRDLIKSINEKYGTRS